MANRSRRRTARRTRTATTRTPTRTRRPRPAVTVVRRDDSGQTWTLVDVEREVASILARLAPGWKAAAIGRATHLHDDLGFDAWGVLRVVKPVRDRLHETLSDSIVRGLKRVGDLVDYVWAKMEDVP